MNVKLNIGATGCYAAITSTTETGGHSALDVLLPAGKSAKAGLLERAAEYQQRAGRMARYARLCRDAAGIV